MRPRYEPHCQQLLPIHMSGRDPPCLNLGPADDGLEALARAARRHVKVHERALRTLDEGRELRRAVDLQHDVRGGGSGIARALAVHPPIRVLRRSRRLIVQLHCRRCVWCSSVWWSRCEALLPPLEKHNNNDIVVILVRDAGPVVSAREA